MTAVKSDLAPTRDRIVAATAELFSRQGYAGTGLKAILAESQAPYGSLYHHFPGGKEELGAVAVEASGRTYLDLVETWFPPGADDLTEATQGFFEGAAAVLAATDYADACPLAMVALETASSSPSMREAAHAAFESWMAVLEARLVDAGVAPTRAREIAVELFCAIEGAFLLCRTARNGEALQVCGRAAAATVAAALPAR
jgi:AcrR family transcriptional regulator